MKELLGGATVLLSIAGHVPYIRDIFRGTTQPHLYTWLVWSIVTTIAFWGQYTTGGGPGAWSTGITLVLTYGITALALWYGTKNVTKLDSVFFVAALVAIVPWLLTDNILFSVILATLIDVVAFGPTIRKTWEEPATETLAMYLLNVVRHGLSIAALSVYSLTTWLYPAALLVMNITVVVVILFRKPSKI